jgi:formylglycine-generating enzyme required for sulfatase activity
MHGNIFEWCLDHWHKNYRGAPTNGSVWLSENPDTPRVMRGGTWTSLPWNCRSACRRRFIANIANPDVGFRIVCASPTEGE